VLGDFIAKLCREDIFKPTFGNESLHEIHIDNGVRVVNFPHTRILLSKILYFHKVTFMNLLGCLLMENSRPN
jgi:hypothetical protein